jgi:hypothetical protein
MGGEYGIRIRAGLRVIPVKIVIFVLLFRGGGGLVFSLSLDALLGNGVAERLVAEGEIARNDREAALGLPPRYVPLAQLLRQTMETLRPNLVMESLFLYTKPPAANREMWTVEERGAIYNETLALSTLAGLEYFSRRRNRMHTLYESSRVVDRDDTKRTLADPVYPAPPARLELTARQKDTTFGDNVYLFTYMADEAAFIVTQENITTITLVLVPVVGKNNMHSVVALLDAGPYLLIYSVSLARVVMLPGIREQMNTSIGNRTAALLAWFSGRADIAYEKTGRAVPQETSATKDTGESPQNGK